MSDDIRKTTAKALHEAEQALEAARVAYVMARGWVPCRSDLPPSLTLWRKNGDGFGFSLSGAIVVERNTG